MDVKNSRDVPADRVEAEGAVGVEIQWLVGQGDQPENFYMRLFAMEPGGHTPRHAHSWEHEVYVLEGTGEVLAADGPRSLTAGSVVHVRAGEEHQFRNSGDAPLRFLCMVPRSAEY
jgi:quercetin dioxygenase-like cupin family protein